MASVQFDGPRTSPSFSSARAGCKTLLLDSHHALRYARENEVRALDYYSSVGQQSSDAEVRRLAAEFAAEETEHVEALDDWLARTPPP